MNSLDINQIKEYLPHRYPMLLVDRVLDYELGKSIVAIKNVTSTQTDNATPMVAVPEPGNMALLLGGVGLMGVVMRRRRPVAR